MLLTGLLLDWAAAGSAPGGLLPKLADGRSMRAVRQRL